MKILGIYDNGGESLDRYTVVTDEKWSPSLHAMLGLSANPTDYNGFSQWTGGQFKRNDYNFHLGKQIGIETLSENVQRHIADRVFGEK